MPNCIFSFQASRQLLQTENFIAVTYNLGRKLKNEQAKRKRYNRCL